MTTSGEEHSLQKIGAGVMDSDAGGFTADERERSAHMLKPLSSDMNDAAGFDDDDDEDEDEDDDDVGDTVTSSRVPHNTAPDMSKLVRLGPQVVAPIHVPPPRQPSPVKPPVIHKPRGIPSDKIVPAGKPVDSSRKRSKGKSVLRSVVASAQPINDSESDAGRARSHTRKVDSGPARSGFISGNPNRSTSEIYSHATQGSSHCVLPVEPLKAVEQYDRSMDFIIQIFREMAGHNLQATDVANMLVIFRNQMRPWCLKEDTADWADAAKYMSAFTGTMESVIRSCADSARARSQQRSALIPPVIPSAPMQSTRRSSQTREHHLTPPPQSVPIEPPHQEPVETTADEMSDVHFNEKPKRALNVAPAGLHYNHPQTYANRSVVPPPYDREPYPDERADGRCLVS